MADRVEQQLGNYRLIRLLGKGGFAEVYLGEHVYLKTQAAIKVLSVRLEDEDMEGFLREAQTIAHLRHPYIVRVLDFGLDSNIPFLVMDYAPNGTLRQRYPRGAPLPLPTIVSYVKQVAAALQYAHDKKLIHRDVKPENMLLGSDNEVLLSDFGIAVVAHSTRSQRAEAAIGTVHYMAPEQIMEKPLPASDQYALGVVVYEWLCGVRPFEGSARELYGKHLYVSPPPLREKVPTISPVVEQVVLTALAKEPQQRFARVQAFANALEQAALSAQSSSLAQPTSIVPSTPDETLSAPETALPPGQWPPPTVAAPHPMQQAQPTASPPPQNQWAQPTVAPPPQSLESQPSVVTPPSQPLSSPVATPSSSQQTVDTPSSPGQSIDLPVSASQSLLTPLPDTPRSEPQPPKVNVWSIGQRQVVAMIIGVVLYTSLAYYTDLLFIQNTDFSSPFYSAFTFNIGNSIVNIGTGFILVSLFALIPIFCGLAFGPWVGLVVGIVGSFLGDLLTNASATIGPIWHYGVGFALIDFIAGLALLSTKGSYNSGRSIAIAEGFSAFGIVAGCGFIALTDISVRSIPSEEAWSIFFDIALPLLILGLIILPILLLTYNAIVSSSKRA